MAGLYVHFPFCASKCIYCDFYARVRRDWDPYAEALIREITDRHDFLKGVPPTTVYYGGGTPSLLPVSVLERVTGALHDAFGLRQLEEFTVEVNPDDICPDKAAALREMGVSRVSMGVQSFCDEHLRWMRRRHTAADAATAFGMLRREGFDNLSLDLIFGFTGLREEQWLYNIGQALALQPEHISCYQMTGRWADPDEELCRRQYLRLQEQLTAAGYVQYETSNYARPGFESRHNRAYWDRSAYLGIGAGAHSFDGDRLRCWNTPDIDRYIAGRPGSEERLSDREILEEKLMLGLRMLQGVDLSRLAPAEQAAIQKTTLEELSRAGKLICEGNRIRIPAAEIFVSDWIISRLFRDLV